MTSLVRIARSAGVLAAVWGIAALVAWVTGVLPPIEQSGGVDPESVATTPDSEPRAALQEADPIPSLDEPTNPTTRSEREEGSPSNQTTATRTAVCAGANVDRPTLHSGQVIGDPRPELLVGCGARFDLYHVLTTNERLSPVRVASFQSPTTPGGRVASGIPGVGDINGDSLPDVVLPFYHQAEGSADIGGSLHLLKRDMRGAFDPPINLGTAAVPALLVAQLDGSAGFDIVAIHRAPPLSRRVSEAWVFAGGPSPRRVGVYRSGVNATSVALADLDRDGERDIVIATEENSHLDVFFGDGTGHFPRRTTIATEGVRYLVSGDIDGDGGEDLLLSGARIEWVRSGPPESLAVRPLEIPVEVEHPLLYDVDGDGDRDLAGLVGGRPRWFRHEGELSFEEEALISTDGLTATALALADFDSDGEADTAIVQPIASTYALVMARSAVGEPVQLGEVARSEDAPLSLRIQLE